MKEAFRFLMSRIVPYRTEVVRLSILAIVSGLIDMAAPIMLGHAIDEAKSSVTLAICAGLFLGWFMTRHVASTIRRGIDHSSSMLADRAAATYFRDVISALLHKPLSFHNEQKHSRIARGIGRIRSDISAFIEMTAFGFMPSMLTTMGYLVAVAWFEWRASLTLLLTVAAYVWYARRIADPILRSREGFREADDDLTSYGYDALANVRTVKTENAERHVMAELRRREERLIAQSEALSGMVADFMVRHKTIALVGVSLATGIALALYRMGEVTTGGLSAIVAYSTSLFTQVGAARGMFDRMLRAAAHLDVQQTIDAAAPERYVGEDRALRGAIEFRDVHFRYRPHDPSSAWVLKGVSFRIEPGETVAVVGRSGEGKTTIADLIGGLYDPTAGTILFDGVPSTAIALGSLRSQIKTVSQSSEMLNVSIHDNVAFSDPGGTSRPVVESASRRAQLHDFVAGLAKGYDTEVGDRGVRLSGGQKQRAALVRTFVGEEPPIVILDEPTSHLDALSEEGVQASLAALSKGTTKIVIAHRLRTVKDADRILVLDGGRIVDVGTHRELITRAGLYRELFQAQGLPDDIGPLATLN